MANIGKYNILSIVRESQPGIYLDGGEHGEILMPQNYVPDEFEIGDELEVFVYSDSEDRLVATTEEPYAEVGDIALLKVIAVNDYGAFLDWGLLKDLLVPYSEQQYKMVLDQEYMVKIFVDDTGTRIAGSSKLRRFINSETEVYEEGQEVNLLITESTDLGYKAIINMASWGIIYHNEVFEDIKIGSKLKGYVNKIRSDDKIDITLQKPGYEKIDEYSLRIIEILKSKNGFNAATDKSPPEMIYSVFEMSKKNFKKAIGSLYKQKIITISEAGIRLIESKDI